MGVVILDKDSIKELLFEELSLTNDVKKIQEELRCIANNLRVLAEELKEPLNMQFTSQNKPVTMTEKGKQETNLIEFDRTMQYWHINELVNQLKEKEELIEDVQKRLYPVRNPRNRYL